MRLYLIAFTRHYLFFFLVVFLVFLATLRLVVLALALFFVGILFG
jgi:hypothetical protein